MAGKKSAQQAVLKYVIRRLLIKNRQLIHNEVREMSGFMNLLMKPRNTRTKWTRSEKDLLKTHLKHLSLYLPVLAIFAFPGGSLLLPVLADILDRRKVLRPQKSARREAELAAEISPSSSACLTATGKDQK